ncbi:DNA glycosylase [Corynespora cassiicola Philippines]|uniref:DNA-(apurinic or apyrimidinic site) lyase n=1 Tax=Corynespora cassiicola Philippines TaxID=1448308 RepID=A0A2T2N2G0_CORCC|nr:DNA glycosylase [Corynespora cassiicola Philippines]
MAVRASEWQKLPISLTELCINTTLRCGQSFRYASTLSLGLPPLTPSRWRKSPTDEWSCTLHGRILSLKQDSTHLHYRALYPASPAPELPTPPPSTAPSVAGGDDDNTLALLTHYLNLRPNLHDLYAHWSSSDPNFRRKAPAFAGIRILRQDPWEALVGFICSSNNHISRISGMVANLCLHYGPHLGTVDGQAYHDFPTPEALAGEGVEEKLKALGFGYRAKYIAKTARMVQEKGIEWLNDLANPELPPFGREAGDAGEMGGAGREGYQQAHAELLALHGVGPKVADCVCLMGLGWSEAVPVDTHVWQIAQRDYKFGKGKNSSLTAAMYAAVGDHFRKLWGKEAGWAHSVLFTADLREFKERIVKEVKAEEEVVVKIEGGDEVVEDVVKKEVVKKKRVKRELDADEHQVLQVKEEVRRSKRLRAAAS